MRASTAPTVSVVRNENMSSSMRPAALSGSNSANLRSDNFPGFSEELKHEINHVFEHRERANSLTMLYYELASDLIDSYISIASHRLNQVMKILTIITAVFIPLGFLAGIYGMNLENMP